MPIPAAFPALGAAAGSSAAAAGGASWLGAAIGAGGGILSGLLGSSGQRAANRTNLKIAREQMSFQRQMSNTAYQRAAKDLEAAGLNRILAIGSPATTPAGARATMLNENALLAEGIKSGVASAFDAVRLRNETAMNQAQIKYVNSQAAQADAQTGQLRAQTQLTAAQRITETLRQAGIRTDNDIKLLDKQIKDAGIPGVRSLKDFYLKLMSEPGQNFQFHLARILGDTKYGMLQKFLLNLGYSEQTGLNDVSDASRIP